MATALRHERTSATLRSLLADRLGFPVIIGFAATLALLGLVALDLPTSLALAALLVIGTVVSALVSRKPFTPVGAGLLGAVHLVGAVVLTLS